MRNKISQREARKLRARVRLLESTLIAQQASWTNSWPSSALLYTFKASENLLTTVNTARRLGHPVVAVPYGDDSIRLFGTEAPR